MSTFEIPFQEIDFHPTSFCDRRGRVFWWKGELYRGITKEHSTFCKKLFEDSVVQKLVEKRFLVETELTDLTMTGYPLVLKHQQVPFVSYANEWCQEMLKDAALFITDMMTELAGDGLTIDVGTYDMLFDGCRPVFVDFCSIEDINALGEGRWRFAIDDFHAYFIYPLQLMAQGYGNLARWLLAYYEHKVIHQEFAALMGDEIYDFKINHASNRLLSIARHSLPHSLLPLVVKGFRLIQSALSRLASNGNPYGLDLVQQMRQQLENIPLPSMRREQRGDEDCLPSFTVSDEWTEKHLSVHKVLSDLRPSTLLDIGSGRGWYSLLAASLGSMVVALDVDDRSVAHCYREVRKTNLPILPLVMDIRYPSPGHGECNKLLAPALQRLRCDMVLALATVHLLAFDQHRTFEQIGEVFAAFSKRWLLVEFVPREDQEVCERWSDWYSWYTLDNFTDTLGKQFRSISIMPSHPEPRVLLLCEK